MKFHVPNMSCGHCTVAITKEIALLDAEAKVTADLETRMVEVESILPAEAIAQAITVAGYEVSSQN